MFYLFISNKELEDKDDVYKNDINIPLTLMLVVILVLRLGINAIYKY